MTLIYFDGFDYLNSSTSYGVLNSIGYYGNVQIIVGSGRFGGNCIDIFAGNVEKTISTNVTTGFVGFAAKFDVGYPGLDQTFAIGDTSNGTTPQFSVAFNQYGVIGLYDSTGTLRASSGINSYIANTWQYIEVGFVISSGAGSVSVRVNGTAVVSVTGISTQQSSNAYGNLLIWAEAGRSNFYVDDIYICNNLGSSPYNTYLGNVRAQALLPTGAGSSTQFSKSSGSLANWQCAINQNCDDTLYVYDATVGQNDLYTIGPAISNVTVFGVQARGCYRQDDATQRSGQTLLKSSTSLATTTAVPCSSSYAMQTDGPFVTDPNTGSAWLYSAVNNLQLGPKVAA